MFKSRKERSAFVHTTALNSPRLTSSSAHPLFERPKHIAKRSRSAVVAVNQSPKGNRDDEDQDEDPELTRRVFLAGIFTTSAFTAAGAYRFVVGEDLESRIKLRISRRFPSLFPRERTAEERRRPLDPQFARAYYDAILQVADELNIIKPLSLKHDESVVQQQAFPLFFENQTPTRTFSDSSWLNFLLYSRMHVISKTTSPASRKVFVDRLSRVSMANLATKPLRQSVQDARAHSDQWIARIQVLLDELISIGWISGYRLEEFDGEPGSSWQDEGRSYLTLYTYDPVTLQAAQLIGEEQYEEISPKPSAWVRAFLNDASINASLEDYYLDDTYRPDPEQFKPSQLATQFDLSLK